MKTINYPKINPKPGQEKTRKNKKKQKKKQVKTSDWQKSRLAEWVSPIFLKIPDLAQKIKRKKLIKLI